MNRNTRLLIVLVASLGMAAAATYFVYQTIAQIPTREVEVAKTFTAVAARPLAMGTLVTANDVKLVGWPADSPVAGGFTSVEEVVNRGLITTMVENEPFTLNNLAVPGAGAGLPPTIPPGMRAISVRVNDVIGVAGFVVPGTRVDVMVILSQDQQSSLARVVVSNAQVLTAGTRFDQEEARGGQPIPTAVVTLLVSPEDAEKVALAANQGQIQLTLRNPLDTDDTLSAGTRASSLTGIVPRAPVEPQLARAVRPRSATPVVAAAPPPPPMPRTVEVIRAAKRTQETVKQ